MLFILLQRTEINIIDKTNVFKLVSFEVMDHFSLKGRHPRVMFEDKELFKFKPVSPLKPVEGIHNYIVGLFLFKSPMDL